MTILRSTLPSKPTSRASLGYSFAGIVQSIGSGCTVSAAARASGPTPSGAGPAAACAAGLPLKLLPTGAAKPPPVLVDDSESPRSTGPGAAGALVGGGVSGGGVSGGGVAVGGGGVFRA